MAGLGKIISTIRAYASFTMGRNKYIVMGKGKSSLIKFYMKYYTKRW